MKNYTFEYIKTFMFYPMSSIVFLALFGSKLCCSDIFSTTDIHPNRVIISKPELKLSRTLISEYVDADFAALKHKLAELSKNIEKCQNPTISLNTEFGHEIIEKYEKNVEKIRKEISEKVFSTDYDYSNFPLLQKFIQIFLLDKELVLLYSEGIIGRSILKVLKESKIGVCKENENLHTFHENLDSFLEDFNFLTNSTSDPKNIFMKLLLGILCHYQAECDRNNITLEEISRLRLNLTNHHYMLFEKYRKIKDLEMLFENEFSKQLRKLN